MIDPRVRRLIELDQEIESKQSEIEKLKADYRALNEEIQQLFIEDGVQSISIYGRCVYMNRQIFASAVPERKEDLRKALESIGLGDFVKHSVNANSISAWIREREQSGEPVPPELDGLLRVVEKFDIRIRKA